MGLAHTALCATHPCYIHAGTSEQHDSDCNDVVELGLGTSSGKFVFWYCVQTKLTLNINCYDIYMSYIVMKWRAQDIMKQSI